jgi:hypothetical protein
MQNVREAWPGVVIRFIYAGMASSLVGCGGGEQAANSAAAETVSERRQVLAGTEQVAAEIPAITVSGLAKIRETRLTRTSFEYVFSVQIKNGGSAAQGVKVKLVEASPGSTIVDGDATFGEVPQGASLASPDTITLRHDRAVAFSHSAMKWAVSLAPTADAVGRDQDANGIRDDIDNLVSKLVESTPGSAETLRAVARSMQRTLDVKSDVLSWDQAKDLLLAEFHAAKCLDAAIGSPAALGARENLFWGTFDTKARRTKRQAVLNAAGAFVLPEASSQECTQ